MLCEEIFYFPSDFNFLGIAKDLATRQLGIESISSDFTPCQGGYSDTVDVLLKSDQHVIIQFRSSPLHKTRDSIHKIARQLLGDKVPMIIALRDNLLGEKYGYAYLMPRIPGRTLNDVNTRAELTDHQLLNFAGSLGKLCGQSFYTTSIGQAEIPNSDTVIPLLEKMILLEPISSWQPTIKNLLLLVPELTKLPLFLRHPDLHRGNILVDENAEITGVIDWEELVRPRYRGTAIEYIVFLSQWSSCHLYKLMEKQFWTGLMEGLTEEAREIIEGNLELFQASVLLGFIFDVMKLTESMLLDEWWVMREGWASSWIRYRIPPLREGSSAISKK